MKTQLRNGSLKNLVVSVVVAASLNVAVSAQPRPRNSTTLSYSERLEIYMDQAEQSLKYSAPDVNSLLSGQETALQNLELISMDIEDMLKYKAPVEFEDQVDRDLEIHANAIMEQLEYHPPVYDQFTNTLVDRPVMTSLEINTKPLTVIDECTPQEAWLINAGYYKSTSKSIFQKVRNNENRNDKFPDEL